MGNAPRLPRRQLLTAGVLGMSGLGLAKSLPAATEGLPPRAKSVIFLYQFGGPSHLESFDPKPLTPAEIRGEWNCISTNVPGIDICEKLPQMARVMDKVTLVRSVHHKMKNHNPAAYYALTGHAPPSDDIRLRDSLDLYPAYGSVVDSILSPPRGALGFVAYPHVLRDGSVTPGQHASFLGKAHDPLLFTEDPNQSDFRLPQLSLPANLSLERLQRRRGIQETIDQQSRLLEYSADARGIDEHYRRAVDLLSGPRVSEAFELGREPESVREKYGRTTYGQGCLLARRLVEAGVRFVNVYFANSIGGQSTTSGGWDTHGFNNSRMYPILRDYLLPTTEQTLPTLLTDLDERGLLDETLVVWMGEFGRTPRINQNASRDHWPQCYTVLLAGGGVKRGFIHGASDRYGAYPAKDAAPLEDVGATLFHLLGVPPATEMRDRQDRPLAVSPGNVITEIIA